MGKRHRFIMLIKDSSNAGLFQESQTVSICTLALQFYLHPGPAGATFI